MALRELTQAEIAAARLRRMASELILEADALEASVAPVKPRTTSDIFINPITGKKKRIKFIGLDD